MSGFADYERYDALGLADLVRRKEVSPLDLLEAAIERVEARNQAVPSIAEQDFCGQPLRRYCAEQCLDIVGGLYVGKDAAHGLEFSLMRIARNFGYCIID